MDSFVAQSSFRRSTWSSRARAAFTSASLLLAVGCSEAGGGEGGDSSTPPPTAVLPGSDGGATYVPPSPVLDSSIPSTVVDSGTRPPVTPTPTPTSDAGPVNTGTGDAGATDAGFTLPDLGTLFPPASDAGTKPADSGVKPGGRDPNGPCKDLNLICFDFIDMFLFNAECSTCNGGKGCQGCAIPYAY